LAAGCRKAADAGIDPTYVSRLERAGENRAVATLEKWAIALDSEMSEFFKIHFVDRRRASAIAGRQKSAFDSQRWLAAWPGARRHGKLRAAAQSGDAETFATISIGSG